VKGRRLPDTKFGELPEGFDEPGTYWKYLSGNGEPMHSSEPSNLTATVWGVHSPAGGVATLTKHTVRENEDGTIDVRPNDGSSNSILISNGQQDWHGYIYNGDWQTADAQAPPR
jgi:hypothetical protein